MDLTEKIENRITATKVKRGRLPRFDTVAKALNILPEDAIDILNKYRAKHGGRVREAGGLGEDDKQDKPVKHFSTILDWLLDGGALILAIAIDLVLNVIVFVTIAPEFWTQIGMGGLAFLVVLFGLRGWIKGGWAGQSLWALFALVATFSDLSFALYVTDVQSHTSKSSDTELTRLTDEAKKASEYLESLQSLQLKNGQGYAQQVKDARQAQGDANAAVLSYRPSVTAPLTSSGVFSAIPDSVRSGRWVELVFFVLIFLGLQLTIVSSASVVKEME